MASRWTVWRNKKKRLEEIDEIYQHHLGVIQASVDETGTNGIGVGNSRGDEPIGEPPIEVVHPEIADEEQESDGDEPGDAKPTLPLKYRLAKFVSEFRLSVEATRALLMVLREEGLDVPKSRVTLLETPQEPITPKREPPGEYYHFGIQECLARLSDDPKVSAMEKITLDVNIDGLPVAKNGRCVWPILAAFPNIRDISSFIIGCYKGLKEPANFESYQEDFVAEVNDLTRNGIEVKRGDGTQRLDFSIRLFICDHPATCKISSVVSHVSKHVCPNCSQVGHRINQVTVYSPTTCAPRDDRSFRNRSDPEHHKVQTISGIERIEGLDMIEQVGVPCTPVISEAQKGS